MITLNVGTDINTRYLAGASWRSHKNTRNPSSETGVKRNAKRSRLGNATIRKLYTHAKAPSFSEYAGLCRKADVLNKRTA